MSDTELQRFKTEIHLAELASSYGYEVVRNESSRSSLVMEHADGDKIIVATALDGHGIFFSVRDDECNGSVIDFVMYREGVSLGYARQTLRKYLSDPNAFFTGNRRRPLLRPEPVPADAPVLYAQWLRMKPYQVHSSGRKQPVWDAVLAESSSLGER